MRKENSFEKYGFRPAAPLLWRKTLYLLPMLALITANLWNGFGLRMSAAETVLYVLTMLCIGFIEEILFRGYLLQMLRESSTTLAILISSLTFGLGHIVNLLNGAAVLDTALQLIYAFSIGMMLSVFVAKTGHILPCLHIPWRIQCAFRFCKRIGGNDGKEGRHRGGHLRRDARICVVSLEMEPYPSGREAGSNVRLRPQRQACTATEENGR